MTETTSIAGTVYRIADLRPIADRLPTVEVAIGQLREAAGPGHTYWIDRAGHHIGPDDLLKDWEAAKRHPDWADHVATIEQADLTDPIWLYEDGSIIDGVHRLTRALRDGVEQVPVKYFQASDLPKEAHGH
ncbi:ParB N-terminal domain-containing protein [Candidatus Berkelbacteria bacterium]|nr:ParB N-terminal domain-containing protein [Candidatus Berkelbacteria bacterium]